MGAILTIRNMVCDRCKAAVARVFDGQHLPVKRIDLGEVELLREPRPDELDALRGALRVEGFELVDDRDAVTIARIKAAIVQLVHHDGELKGRVKLGDHLRPASCTRNIPVSQRSSRRWKASPSSSSSCCSASSV